MLIQSNLTDFLFGIISGGFWLANASHIKTKHADAFQLFLMRFEDFDILINKGFLNTREIDQYIVCIHRGNMQQIIRGVVSRTRL